MAAATRPAVFLIFALGLISAWTPAIASGSDPGQDPSCVTLVQAFFGSPLEVRPFYHDAIGVILTEQEYGSGATLGLIVVPSACNTVVSTPIGTQQVFNMADSDFGPAIPLAA